MLGHIYLFDTKLKRNIKIYKDEELYNDNNSQLRLEIKNNFLDKYKNRYILICACNSSVELSIDSLGRIYHKNKADALKHDYFCERHKHYTSNMSKGITLSNNKKYYNLNFNILPNSKSKNQNNKKFNQDSIGLQELSKHINILASKYKTNTKFDILNRAYYLSEEIYIKGFKDKTLQDFYFSVKDYRKISSTSPKFIYMYLSEINSTENPEYIKIKCEYAENKHFEFISHIDLFNKEYLSKYINNIKNPVIISGFINKTELGLEFYELSLIKVNKNGIY